MTLSELKKMIDELCSEAVAQPMREPEIPQQKRPVYRPVLQNEDDIDLYIFNAGTKPEDK